ncbi:pre-mRNA splicing factor component domain-containing protein [Ditylenchus destructor]|uniref:Pre-mRNA splicing factor component domain-containing protein n=1 Tax=Ditylenchus destructor TaxID=166010 RepID=A0AAD4QY76_9BILA|nr:pre-mRNA splicing factor component domain-containing protein [Ditylenchus destructor]
MVRVIIKGGVWKNTEDEILKAAIMKYGKNQWSRIASLLHRKSAKQCKARWYEWLDPRIKKTEWSREEDEKLLHLAKIMPTQWRTIAPIVGRTAAQCLERYEHLLDEAQRRAEGIDEADTLKEAKKLKAGDVDPTPETKPARPDPVDMDEDELEMLSEARARLANTQGKKAKRKAREKQLGEARRLASLQKRRELRAAGIMAGNGAWRFRKRGLIDYNAEIPFEKNIPIGFHDPTEDSFDKSTMEKIEEKRRDHKEFEDRKKDKEKLKKRKGEDNPQSIFAEKHEKKRSKLLLPEPQISDKELDEIIKIGHASDTVRELVDDNPSSTLLHDYTQSARNPAAARTLRTPSVMADSIARAADDLLALTNVETPLKGGLNTPLHTTDFSAPSSARQVVATPNTVLAAVAATPKTIVEQTPGSQISSTPGSTPFRDQLNINQEPGNETFVRDNLRKQFKSLPKPRNDFELMAPEAESMEEADGEGEWTEDAAEVNERNAQKLAKQRELEMMKRSQVMQRKLPLPSKLNELYKKPPSGKLGADDFIKAEVYAIMEWDVNNKEPAHIYEPEQMTAARQVILKEMERISMEEAGVSRLELDANMWHVVENCSKELIRHQNRLLRFSTLSRRDQLDFLQDQFQMYHNWMTQQSKQTQKIEKKMKVKLGGYAQIQANLQAKIDQLRKDQDRLLIELKTFQRLEENELKAIYKRRTTLQEELREQEEREKILQKRFGQLEHRRWELDQMEKREHASTIAAPVSYNKQ